MSHSPIERLLAAISELSAAAVVALMAPDVCLLMLDGSRAEGRDAVGELLAKLFAELRSATYSVTAQWHEGSVWMAELDATYELPERALLGPLPRAFVLHDGPVGISTLHVYGANERPLSDRPTGEEGTWLGGQGVPPL